LAVTVISATEGVVAVCRAERSMEPFEDVEAVLLSLIKSLSAAGTDDDAVKVIGSE
jgi:hypothetical protein